MDEKYYMVVDIRGPVGTNYKMTKPIFYDDEEKANKEREYLCDVHDIEDDNERFITIEVWKNADE